MNKIVAFPKEPLMPEESPLAMPSQNLSRYHKDGNAPFFGSSTKAWLARLAVFLPALAITAILIAEFTDWFAMDGLIAFEVVLIGLIAATFFWISLSVSTSIVGITNLFRRSISAQDVVSERLKVALLVPVYNEDVASVFGNACAMLDDLAAQNSIIGSRHYYELFILSDSTNANIAAQEQNAMGVLRGHAAGQFAVHYRRRAENIDRKTGNISDWITRWGGAYDAMLVLDADSLMSGKAIASLTGSMAQDPTAGLVQSFPRLIGAQTVFGRIQQFSNAIYGAPLAEGLAKWASTEGNYWGHNAIIRTAAFADCAGLPKLDGFFGRKSLILSHDFVEAGLLRRAGWAVRFEPDIADSYEEVPQTVIDYVKRDRRWCQGNLQHLRLLGGRGFHTATRFHLFHGAMSYLLSPAWFMLLMAWALIGQGQETNVIQYFSGTNPQVSWPEVNSFNNFAILMFMYAMLLAPKFLGALTFVRSRMNLKDVGGLPQFLVSFFSEVFASVVYAPILMVQQTLAVIRSFLGWRERWVAQSRTPGQYGLLTLIKFHWFETILGCALIGGMLSGFVTVWLIPIAGSLALAVPLSWLSGFDLRSFKLFAGLMGTAERFNPPKIIERAHQHRDMMRQRLSETYEIAAE